MINGTIIGEINIAIIVPLNGMFRLLKPKAATVPNAVAKNVAAIPMIKLFLVPSIHLSVTTVVSNKWMLGTRNSFIIGISATFLATALGTVAALGLSRRNMPFKGTIMAILISPMIVPLIITSAGMFFFYSKIGLTHTYLGLILAHTALGTPFVVITVTATLTGFDTNLIRASQSLGADTMRTFFKVIMPLILPGVISGALFAFITSFDEVVVVMFVGSVEQITIPKQMWAGLRQETSPVILCMATCLVALSIALLTTVEMLRRRSERLRGIKLRN